MTYDWAVVGGGVTGIAIAEILTREGHRVILIERHPQLASETSGLFHEWIHTGSLYTLIPDRLRTVKFLLGAIDDLLEYYSSFERMNLTPTESGLVINGSTDWFAPNHITFRYRRRRLNLPWSLTTARSAYLVNQIKKHDWLRRRGGTLDEFRENKFGSITEHLRQLMGGQEEFYDVVTSDFTTNSRHVLRDLVATALSNDLELSLGNPVRAIEHHNGQKVVVTEKGSFKANRVVLCSGKQILAFHDVKVKTSLAPIAVVAGLGPETRSFVELDYHVRTCINLIAKPGGAGLIGGISMKTETKALEYLKYVIARHLKLNPQMKIVDTYMGEKNEILFPNQDRNYLFHIIPTDQNVWAVVPGKFTLGFSLAAEFYRRVYKKNPRRTCRTVTDTGDASQYVADTLWAQLIEKHRGADRDGAYQTS